MVEKEWPIDDYLMVNSLWPTNGQFSWFSNGDQSLVTGTQWRSSSGSLMVQSGQSIVKIGCQW